MAYTFEQKKLFEKIIGKDNAEKIRKTEDALNLPSSQRSVTKGFSGSSSSRSGSSSSRSRSSSSRSGSYSFAEEEARRQAELKRATEIATQEAERLAQEEAKLEAEQKRLAQQYERTINKRQAARIFEKRQNEINKKINDYNRKVNQLNRLNKKIEDIPKQSEKNFQFYIKQLEQSAKRKTNVNPSVTKKSDIRKELKKLNKPRDSIYTKIKSLNNEFSGNLTQEQYGRYREKLAPIIAEWNVYNKNRSKLLSKLPDNEIKTETIIDPITGQKALVVSAKDVSLSNKINEEISKSINNLQRNKNSGIETLKLSGLVASQSGLNVVEGYKQLPSTIKAVIKNPEILAKIPEAIQKSGKEFGGLLRVSPTAGIVKAGSELFVLKGTNAVLSRLGKVPHSTLIKLNPKYLGELKTGKDILLKLPRGKIARLKVVGKIPKKSIPSQIGMAGKRVTATSTQADRLLTLFQRTKTIRKPLGKEIESKIGKKALQILKKYDSGERLTLKETAFLNKKIQQAGSKGLLERSFFADPTGKIRPSRLGIQKDKPLTYLDYVTEGITFRKAKPQILVFENIKLSNYPKSLQPIIKKIKLGKTLSEIETAKLLKFQSKKSGKFKTLGFISKESEITLAPGEVIKKGKKIGVARYKGTNVPLIRASVVQSEGQLKKLLIKARTGTRLTPKESNYLKKQLKKKTGFDYKLSSNKRTPKKYVSPKRLSVSVGSKLLNSKNLKKSLIKYTKSGRPYIITSSGARFISPTKFQTSLKTSPERIKSPKSIKPAPKSTKPAPKSTPVRYIQSPSSKSTVKPRTIIKSPIPLKVQERFSKKTLPRKVPTYYVVEKVRGKFKKLYPKPLTIKDARDYAVYSIDNKLSKTAFFVPLGTSKNVVKLPAQINNYYLRNSQKVRPYKIRFGEKKQLLNGYIEKNKYFIDTVGERLQARKLRKKAREVKKKKK